MRSFSVAYHTDIGIKRQSNQDSLLIKGLGAGASEIVLAVLCDGMGGMEKGELATVIEKVIAEGNDQITPLGEWLNMK